MDSINPADFRPDKVAPIRSDPPGTVTSMPSPTKLHHLHIVRNTLLEKQYRENPFPLLGLEEYADLVVDFLERLNPDICIERLFGSAPSIVSQPTARQRCTQPVQSIKTRALILVALPRASSTRIDSTRLLASLAVA